MVLSHSLVEAGVVGAELNLGKDCTASLIVSAPHTDSRSNSENGPIACQAHLDQYAVTPMMECTDLWQMPGYRPGCEPARCGRTSRQPRIKTAIRAEASGRLRSRPPSLTGLSRKSPTVAPSGRVRMNAAQNRRTRDTLVQK